MVSSWGAPLHHDGDARRTDLRDLIVHRDIKPESFFVTKDDVIEVMGFGIAKKTTAASNMLGKRFEAVLKAMG
ncbi:MAG TPA: hypothetical protein ENK57_14440 [Polyangiaceae bacterium]|nr:hypothetical protein [Polyangiaceae bacterium]